MSGTGNGSVYAGLNKVSSPVDADRASRVVFREKSALIQLGPLGVVGRAIKDLVQLGPVGVVGRAARIDTLYTTFSRPLVKFCFYGAGTREWY